MPHAYETFFTSIIKYGLLLVYFNIIQKGLSSINNFLVIERLLIDINIASAYNLTPSLVNLKSIL